MAKIWFLTLVAICCDFRHAGVTSAAQSTERRDQASYFIQGAVRKPGVYKIEGSSSVLKLIALAVDCPKLTAPPRLSFAEQSRNRPRQNQQSAVAMSTMSFQLTFRLYSKVKR